MKIFPLLLNKRISNSKAFQSVTQLSTTKNVPFIIAHINYYSSTALEWSGSYCLLQMYKNVYVYSYGAPHMYFLLFILL